MAADIESPAQTSEDRTPARRGSAPRRPARTAVKPLRSIAIFGAVGALVAAVALPAYAATKPVEATASLQQIAVDEAQSLVVASEVTAAPLDRGTYTATTPDEIAKKKAEEAAAARAAEAAAAARASLASAGGSRSNALSNIDMTLTAPGSGEVRHPLPYGSYNVTRTVGGAHQGVDMVGKAGTPIFAVTSGVVRASAESIGGYGVAVMIDGNVGGSSVATTYGHMIYGSRMVQVGDTVAAGQMIGLMGTTGRSTANHLHLEVRVNGGLMEPVSWLAANEG